MDSVPAISGGADSQLSVLPAAPPPAAQPAAAPYQPLPPIVGDVSGYDGDGDGDIDTGTILDTFA